MSRCVWIVNGQKSGKWMFFVMTTSNCKTNEIFIRKQRNLVGSLPSCRIEKYKCFANDIIPNEINEPNLFQSYRNHGKWDFQSKTRMKNWRIMRKLYEQSDHYGKRWRFQTRKNPRSEEQANAGISFEILNAKLIKLIKRCPAELFSKFQHS